MGENKRIEGSAGSDGQGHGEERSLLRSQLEVPRGKEPTRRELGLRNTKHEAKPELRGSAMTLTTLLQIVRALC